MKNRRNFLQQLGALGLLGLAGKSFSEEQAIEGLVLSKDRNATTLVFLANFFCSNSGQANTQMSRITEACRTANIGFRFAPVSQEPQTLWPDRIYYTARDLYPATEPLIRNGLIEGAQKKGLPFESMSQVLTYLMSSEIDKEAMQKDMSFDLATIAALCTHEEMELVRYKAINLSIVCQSTILPAFLWIKNGEIIKEMSPENFSTVPLLVNNVVKTILQPT